MKVLMFGWEFPPKIYGGLAVASYGITKGLSLQGDMETIFCMPKPSGEEEKFLKIIKHLKPGGGVTCLIGKRTERRNCLNACKSKKWIVS